MQKWPVIKDNKHSKHFNDSPHHTEYFSLRKFNVTLDCFHGWSFGMLVDDSMLGNPDIRATGNGAWWRATKSQRDPLKSAPSRGGSGPQYTT